MRRPPAAFTILLAPLLLAGCRTAPPDLREWKASDHDRADDQAQLGRQVSPAPPTSGGDPNATVIEVTWRNQCTTCHGVSGLGDGPQGPMVKAADLSRVDWQTNTSDAEILSVIVNGKNRMPKFDLPPDIASGLVRKVRSFRRAP